MDIAQRIKLLREETLDLTQGELAERLGIHKNSLGRYERGDSTPDSSFIVAMCSIFCVRPEWLLFGTGPIRADEQTQRREQPPAEDKDTRIRELEKELAEARREAMEAYKLVATTMRPIAEDIQEIKQAINAPTHNKRIDEKEDQIKQVGK